MLVTALSTFTYNGRQVRPGTRVDVTPIDATVLRRRGYVTLSNGRVLHTTALVAERDSPPPEPLLPKPIEPHPSAQPAVPLPATEPDEPDESEAPRPRAKRAYRRRDMTAEPAADPSTVAE